MNGEEPTDHKLHVDELLFKYGIKRPKKKIYFSVHSLTARKHRTSTENTIFPLRDHTLLQLIIMTLLEPINILSFFSAASLVVIYFFNREEKQHLLVFLFTASIMVIKTAIEVHEESKINLFYKERIDSYPVRIIEDDQIWQIDKNNLQVGDILDLRRGDIVGADAILISANNLMVDTSTLSGSHDLIKKNTKPSDTRFVRAKNVVLSSDKITSGRGKAVVVRVGKMTELGMIYSRIMYHKNIQSSMSNEMNVFFYGSMMVSFILCCILTIAAAIYGMSFANIFALAVSIFIAVTPEGISATIKLLLFSAVSKLYLKGILIRDAAAIEKLGLVTMITAKTQSLVNLSCKVCDGIYDGEKMIDIDLAFQDNDDENLQTLERIGRISYLISTNKNKNSTKSYHSSLKILGDMCNRYFVGLTRMSTKIKDVEIRDLRGTLINEVDFKSIYITGEPESLLNLCTKYRRKDKIAKLTMERRNKILKIYKKMKLSGEEAIALAMKSYGLHEEKIKIRNLIFECIYFLDKEPELDTPIATNIFKTSGIGFSVLTKTTSESELNSSRKLIGVQEKTLRESGLLHFEESDHRNLIRAAGYESKSLKNRNRFIANENFIIYGCEPQHKCRVVEDLQRNGHVVAFVGSETDDWDALNKSDFGICFEDAGQMCKEASSVVLEPQQFENIVYGVEEGRLFFVNLQKSVKYILMHNTPQLLPFTLYALVGTPLPLSPILLILLNYLVEVIPAKFFAYEEPEYNLMLKEPINSPKNNDGSEYSIYLGREQPGSGGQLNRFFVSFRSMLAKSTIYSLSNLSWPVLEAGLISGLGCMLAFYMVLFQQGIPVSMMFFSANKYFLFNSPSMTLRDGTEADFNKQIEIVFAGQSTFFLGLMICQFSNMLVCRRSKEYFFHKFFNNPRILLFSLLGITISTTIVFLGIFDEFLLVREPFLQPLVVPSTAAVLIISLDTYRKYQGKKDASIQQQFSPSSERVQ